MAAKQGGGILGWAVLMMALASCSPTRTPAFAPALSQSRQYYQAGEFQRAIDVNAAALDKFPAEAAVREEYIKTLEGIHGQAQAAVAAKDYAAAERLFTLLLDNFPKYESLGKSLSFSAPGLNRSIRLCRTTIDERRAAQHLQAGEYDRALGDLRALSAAELRDPGRAATLSKTMAEIKRRADGAASSRNFVEAGKAYAVLAGRYADASKLGLKLPFSRDSVDEGLKRCRFELTRQGLEHYRKGELAEAIAVWQGLLRFDPANAEIRKAVETARQQQKAIKKNRP